MTLQQLACFCATAREGSFSGAARRLRLAQPSVSDQVRRLESELNTRLIVTNGRGVTLTPDGRTFQARAERVLASADEAAASVGGGVPLGTRVLNIGLARNAPYYPFWELAELALDLQPQLRIRFPGLNSSMIADAVRSGELHAAVVILPVDPDGLEISPLFKDEVLFVTADPGRARRPMQIEDLVSAPLILYDTSAGFDDPTRRQLAARAQQSRTELLPRFDVEHPEMALQLAAQGLGDTVAARALTQSSGFPAGLCTVSFAEPLYDSFALVTRTGAVSPALGRFLSMIEDWAAELLVRSELEAV